MKRTIIITSVVVVLAIVIMVVISKLSGKEDLSALFAEVQQGEFEIVVTTTGGCRLRSQLILRGRRALLKYEVWRHQDL
ncbi:MAG: hypothetical protein R2758_06920 [Bacteroidales bacterium]